MSPARKAALLGLSMLLSSVILLATNSVIAGFIQCSALGCLPQGGAAW